MTLNTKNDCRCELKVSSGGERPNLCSCNLQDSFLEQAPQIWREPQTPDLISLSSETGIQNGE